MSPLPPPRGEDHGWTEEEVRQLGAVVRLLSRLRGAQSWQTGITDARDPQLYVLGPAPEETCIACVSRIGTRYVVEDGSGHLVAEAARIEDLGASIKAACPAMRRLRLGARAVLVLAAARTFIDEKMAAIEEALEVAMRVGPQLAAMA